MDQLGQLFQSSTGDGGWLSKFLTSPGLKVGLAGNSAIGNILANRSRNQVLSKEMQQMDALNKLTPAQITSGISALQQPLSANLQNSVANMTQGKLAERGLSQAPGIFASELGQGLAPYQLQEQQLAQDAYFKKLGLPISARPSPFGPFPQTTNTSQLWQSLMSQFMGTADKLNNMPKQITEPNLINQLWTSNFNGAPGIDSWLPYITGLTTPPLPTGTDFSSTQSGGGETMGGFQAI